VQFNYIYLRSTCFTVSPVKAYGFPCFLLVSIVLIAKAMAAPQNELGTPSQPLKRLTVTRTEAHWQSVSLNCQKHYKQTYVCIYRKEIGLFRFEKFWRHFKNKKTSCDGYLCLHLPIHIKIISIRLVAQSL
jgi:hypothetical protein